MSNKARQPDTGRRLTPNKARNPSSLAMPAKSFLWFRPDEPQWMSEIHLLENSQVIFRDTIPHGHWAYQYDPDADVGRFKIMFHCRGDEATLKKHELLSIPQTSCYRLVSESAGYSQIVMIPLEP